MEVFVSQDRPDLEQEVEAAFRERWLEFIFHDKVSRAYLPRVQEYFRSYDILLPRGYDDALVRAVEGHEQGEVPNTFSFMAAAVVQAYDKQGLATAVLGELSERAHADDMEHVIAPIRPTWKKRYPRRSRVIPGH